MYGVLGTQIFVKLDTQSMYNCIRLRSGDEKKTEFCFRYSHFEYQVIPFAVLNGLATFQSYIYSVLRDCLNILCIAYLDDILIYFLDPKTHKDTAFCVSKQVIKHGLFVNLAKCVSIVLEIRFLSFLLTTEGVQIELSCTESIKNCPKPASVQDIQVFGRFSYFYKRFIKEFLYISAGLISIL